MEKILTGFCYTDIHNQQAMLDYPTTVRKSFVQAKDLAIEEFGLAEKIENYTNLVCAIMRIRNNSLYK